MDHNLDQVLPTGAQRIMRFWARKEGQPQKAPPQKARVLVFYAECQCITVKQFRRTGNACRMCTGERTAQQRRMRDAVVELLDADDSHWWLFSEVGIKADKSHLFLDLLIMSVNASCFAIELDGTAHVGNQANAAHVAQLRKIKRDWCDEHRIPLVEWQFGSSMRAIEEVMDAVSSSCTM